MLPQYNRTRMLSPLSLVSSEQDGLYNIPISRRAALKGLAASTLLLSSVGCASYGSSPIPAPTPMTPHHPLGSILFTYRGHTDRVTTVDWSPDGKHIASGSLDKTVQVWDAENNQASSHPFIYRGHIASVTTVAWSHDSKRIASGSEDMTAQVWDTLGGSALIYRGHRATVTAVSWSSDGKHIASSSFDITRM
jgi:WD40 repeat protein